MREQTALLKQFNNEEELTSEPVERKRKDGEFIPTVTDTCRLPTRNWEALIGDYNSANKRKFPITPLECKVVIEYVKRGIPAELPFQYFGYSKVRFNNLKNNVAEMELQLEELATKPNLNDEEFDTFQTLMRNPWRILFADIDRAEGLASLVDWEHFNAESLRNNDIMLVKMKAKYKDSFNEKDTGQNQSNVVINIGSGDWLDNL